jgi:cytochrome c oxidase cbb3-type subunit IV
MDVNDLRSAVTVLLLIAFLGIVRWAWSARNRSQFDDAAQVPFLDDDKNTGSAR